MPRPTLVSTLLASYIHMYLFVYLRSQLILKINFKSDQSTLATYWSFGSGSRLIFEQTCADFPKIPNKPLDGGHKAWLNPYKYTAKLANCLAGNLIDTSLPCPRCKVRTGAKRIQIEIVDVVESQVECKFFPLSNIRPIELLRPMFATGKRTICICYTSHILTVSNLSISRVL